MNSIAIENSELDVITHILNQHVPDKRVYAFGSRVTGKAKPFSDLDLVIVTDEPLPALSMYSLATAFEESNLKFKVDIVDWASTSPQFKKIIQAQWVPFK